MKISRYFLLAATLLTGLTACDSDLEKTIYSPEKAASGQLSSSETSIKLTAATNKKEVLTLNWKRSEFGLPVEVTYNVELDTRGGDFTNAYTLASTPDTTVTFTGRELNAAVIALQKQKNPDAETSFDEQQLTIRITSSFSDDAETLVSNILDINITPYAGKQEFAKMSVPGGHNGWNVTDYTQALYATDTSKPNVYEGYIYMGAGNEFKVTLGSWDAGSEWGSSDGITLVPSGSNITVDEAGCYYIRVDLDALTLKVEKRNWSLVGDAIGGWEQDIDMEYDSSNNIYRATYTFSGEGEFKFRANHSWDINYGADADGDPGDLKLNGDNIKPLPGEYTVALSFADGYPTYTLYAGTDISQFYYLSLPGTMNGWDAGTEDNVMLDLTKSGSYEGYIYLDEGAEFKIADGSWSDNWGSADLTTLVRDGDNIKAEAGMYIITANIDDLVMSLTRTDWSIVGSAVAGDTSWNTDYDLTWNPETKVLEGTFELAEGEFKFRANKDWPINYGGNGEENQLARDGQNLYVTAGKYHITLDLQTSLSHLAPTYTITAE